MGSFFSALTNNDQSRNQSKSPQVEACKRLRMSPSIHNHENPRLIPTLPDEISLQILARLPRTCYLSVKMVSRSWKVAIASSELYQLRKEIGTTEEWLYILTKEDEGKLCWHALDPINGRWQRLPPMPNLTHEEESKRGLRVLDLMGSGIKIADVIRSWLGRKDSLDRMPYCGCGIGAVNGCLYVLGGFSRASTMKSVLKYDPCVNSWLEVSSMTTGRAFCKTSVLNSKLYVVGGVSRGRNGLAPLQSAEVYDPDTGLWDPVPSMPFSKAQVLPTAFLAELLKPIATGMTSYRGRLYVPQSLYSWPFFVDVGGEVFDPETNSWVDMPAGMGEGWPGRQAGTKLSMVVNGELYAYALDPSSSLDSGKIKIYDHQEDSWKVVLGKVPVRDFTDSESPYLLAGFHGKLHVITKDINNEIAILQADLPKHIDSDTASSSSSTDSASQDLDAAMESDIDIWRVIAAKSFNAAELISCQVLNI
ncbi:F-box/kelch-repeat protein At1g22040-like [Ananas comosus]|uniref:F-box/kelch-repeat protein At1g22040-like n=1 Tax=Ananas comosus TaxID=4615 RepID=A0A6P5G9P3_ANACO|nr:F-box/kelch-repeat protein At1g22040-like [Ananas comosus]XP_020104526.1 F-box/kelch-repeat protein At1g22040-like [Ananas comosus]XP_020104527.1 F-box/kelch-repeat protein At1g22040-like [Ananas comosus]XP_020104528.1 F-box/kelch-repeat protein At1g22040-like [Ananas comosus]